jgi:hypothetical protein
VHDARVAGLQLLIDPFDQALVLIGGLGFGLVANQAFHLVLSFTQTDLKM